jgi:2-methylisocitrate lyase-like PEP mutase family enzyme
MSSARQWFIERIKQPKLLVAPGAHDPFTASLIAGKGAEVIYCGGFATTAAAYGLPDIGLMGLADMLDVYRRIAAVVDRPLIVDADTGYGGPLNVSRTVSELGRIGIAAIHIEDQVDPKRCGHIAGKRVLSLDDASRRVAAAAEASAAGGPAIIARTDALAVEGMDSVLARGRRFADAGAHAFFVDAVTSVEQIKQVIAAVKLPLVYNAASTGVSPNLSQAELSALGVAAVIYPIELLMASLAATRAMIESILAGGRITPPVTFAELTGILKLDEFVQRDRRLGG